MAAPARNKWWHDVVSVDSVKLENGTHLLWGDRVQILEEDSATDRVKIFGRGTTGWVDRRVLGGEPLLELYFIDVGQGDGILVVTPEGHHLLIDGGHSRGRQPTGKSAADFVDWKFHKDYLHFNDRDNPDLNMIRIDAMIASHADADHYGGLEDLVDRETPGYQEELDSFGVSVEAFYHPGLCPQQEGTDKLGRKRDNHFYDLLEDRDSMLDAIKSNPDGEIKARGWWKDFLVHIAQQQRADGSPTLVKRLSRETEFLPGFSPDDDTTVTVRVLAPVTKQVDGAPGLKDLGNEGYNKNGHSVALRLDYGERRFLLTGDLNEKSHALIIDDYGDDFVSEWQSDVAKACHHGSHHADMNFMRGVGALATVFSSGDANTFDHPRAWVLAGAAISGRVVEDPNLPRLRAPLIYSTEVARSVDLGKIEQLRGYEDQQKYGVPSEDPVQTISGDATIAKWRLVFDHDSPAASAYPPIAGVRAVRGVVYGLVNVRTDGERVLFAVRNEGNKSWAGETLEPDDFQRAYRLVRSDLD
ncbi:MAG: hypothetical protein H6815_08140 [Phycisphaeraceae bacterium]|nr:hypothetical protein [Phycisphaerales bacterium]MCB9860410.1 hypothetical protein [Phycisphaeraceae bacterium]